MVMGANAIHTTATRDSKRDSMPLRDWDLLPLYLITSSEADVAPQVGYAHWDQTRTRPRNVLFSTTPPYWSMEGTFTAYLCDIRETSHKTFIPTSCKPVEAQDSPGVMYNLRDAVDIHWEMYISEEIELSCNTQDPRALVRVLIFQSDNPEWIRDWIECATSWDLTWS